MDYLLFEYIKSTFNYGINIDSKQFSGGKPLKLLEKNHYNIYVSQITYEHLKHKQITYTNLLRKTLDIYSQILDNKIKFTIIDTMQNADIKVFWRKSSIKRAGVQYTEFNNGMTTLCMNIGVMDINGKNLTSNEVYHLLLHEFGHIMCLGHSPIETDVMCSSGDWSTTLTPNDIFVLKLIYKIGSGHSYNEVEELIKKEVKKFLHGECKSYKNSIPQNKNLIEDLTTIGELNLYNNTLHNSISINFPRNLRE